MLLTLKVLNFWKLTSYCSTKPLWSGMGEVVPARTSPTLHLPFPPTVHQLSRLALWELIHVLFVSGAVYSYSSFQPPTSDNEKLQFERGSVLFPDKCILIICHKFLHTAFNQNLMWLIDLVQLISCMFYTVAVLQNDGCTQISCTNNCALK